MALGFPNIASSALSSTATNQTSHTVTMPSGIVSGDLLIIVMANDDLGGFLVVTYPAGWTKFFNRSNQARLSCAWRKADGTEGGSITVTTSSNETMSCVAYRIDSTLDPTVTPPKASIPGATGSSANPDPNSLAVDGPTRDYLWIAIHGHDGNNRTTTGIPTGYGNQQSIEVGTLGGCGVGCADRDLNATSEDPGTFSISASDGWVAGVIAVYPIDTDLFPDSVVVSVATPVLSVARTLIISPDAVQITVVAASLSWGFKFFPDPIPIQLTLPGIISHHVYTPDPIAIPVVSTLPFVDVDGRLNPDPVQIPFIVREVLDRSPYISVTLDITILPSPIFVSVTLVQPLVALQALAGPILLPVVPLRWMPTHSSVITGILKGCTFRFATLWRINPDFPSSPTLYFTNHNEEIVFEGNTYEPAGGFNASAHEEREGLKASSFSTKGIVTSEKITEEDLRAGVYREAEVTEYIVDWRWPWIGAIAEQTFWIEEIEWDTDSWKAELTGITNRLREQVGRRYEFTCQWRLGEGQCGNPGDGVDLLTITESGSVTLVEKQRKIFTTSLNKTFTDGHFQDGLLIWTSGSNQGLAFEVRAYELLEGKIFFHIKTPFDIQVEDDFTVYSGCDKRFVTCKDKFDNVINFGGFNKMPLTDEVIRAPEAKRA